MCYDLFRTGNPIVDGIRDAEERIAFLRMELSQKQDKCPKHKWKVEYTPYDDGWGIPIDVPQWTRTCEHCYKVEKTEEFTNKAKKRIPIWRDKFGRKTRS